MAIEACVDRGLLSIARMTAIVLVAGACRPQPAPTPNVAPAPVPSVRQPAAPAREEAQPALAYCIPRAPNLEDVAFALDYDGSDGTHEPRFSGAPISASPGDAGAPQPERFSVTARELCLGSSQPTNRRYLLRVPINAEPRHLDSYLRNAARRGFDEPILKVGKVVVATQIVNPEYAYSATPQEPPPETIGTTTIEANEDGQYELRARVTDGQELSSPIGVVPLPPRPDLADCESKTADEVRRLCAHEVHPCDRVALVGVNDIGGLLTALGYVQAVTERPMTSIALQQRHQGVDKAPYQDGAFRRAHRVKRFFSALKPEADARKLTATESLAKKQVNLHSPLPSSLVPLTEIATDLHKRLAAKEWSEIGKAKACDYPGRTAASLVVDKNDQVRLYAESVKVTDRAELLLRAYYDEKQRLRLVVNSETTDTGEAWDAYLVLDENGCPTEELIVTRAELPTNLLHWELKPLLDPKAAYAEPLCIGQVP